MPVAIWRSVCGTHEVSVVLKDDPCICSIFHEDARSLQVQGVQSSWIVGELPVTSLRLPCGHEFNTSALALHFVSSDMRCPVCRAGRVVKMDVDNSVPGAYVQEFRTKLEEMQCVETLETEEFAELEITTAEMEAQIKITAEAGYILKDHETDTVPWSAVICCTRLYPRNLSPHHPPDSSFFDTQRSFSRLLNTYICKYKERTDMYVRFSFNHPFLTQSIKTPNIPLTCFRDNTEFVFSSEERTDGPEWGKMIRAVDEESSGNDQFHGLICIDTLMAMCVESIDQILLW